MVSQHASTRCGSGSRHLTRPWVQKGLFTVYDGRVYITHPWGGFSKLDCSATKMVPVVSVVSIVSIVSHRTIRLGKALGEIFPTLTVCVTDTVPTVVEVSTMEDRPTGV